MFDIVRERDHFVVLRDGEFWCSCDTMKEAEEEVADVIPFVQPAQAKQS